MAPVNFSSLAYETTSLIFQHACSVNPYLRPVPHFKTWDIIYSVDRTPIILGSVCLYWRRVACQTPELWKVLTIQVRKNISPYRYAHLLRSYMERVGHLDFSLNIRLEYGHHSASDVEPIANILFDPKHASQVSALCLFYAPVESMPMLSRLSRMHTLHLRTDILPERFEFQLDLPCLRHFFFEEPFGRSSNLENIHLPPSVEYAIVFTSAIIQKNLLYQCPNLIEFRTPFSIGLSSFESPITLTHLEALELDMSVGLLGDSAAQHLNLPCLKTLYIRTAERSNPPDSLITFCHRLSATLTTLGLMGFIIRGDEFSRRLFGDGKLLRLETLRVTECDTFNLSCAIRALAPAKDHSNPKPLPSLRQLVLIPEPVVEDGLDDWEELEVKTRGMVERAILPPLLQMLQKRGDGIHSQFRVQIPRVNFDYAPAARYGFYQLLKERQIEIYSTAGHFDQGRQYSANLELI